MGTRQGSTVLSTCGICVSSEAQRLTTEQDTEERRQYAVGRKRYRKPRLMLGGSLAQVDDVGPWRGFSQRNTGSAVASSDPPATPTSQGTDSIALVCEILCVLVV